MHVFSTGSASKISDNLRLIIAERLKAKSQPFAKRFAEQIERYAHAYVGISNRTHTLLAFLVKPENKETLSKLEGFAANPSAKEQLLRELDSLENQLRQSSRKSFRAPLVTA